MSHVTPQSVEVTVVPQYVYVDEGQHNCIVATFQLNVSYSETKTWRLFELSTLIHGKKMPMEIGEFKHFAKELIQKAGACKVALGAIKGIASDDPFLERTVTGAFYRELLRFIAVNDHPLNIVRIPYQVARMIHPFSVTGGNRQLAYQKINDPIHATAERFYWDVARNIQFNDVAAHLEVLLERTHADNDASPFKGTLKVDFECIQPDPQSKLFELLVYLLAFEIWERRNSNRFLQDVKEYQTNALSNLLIWIRNGYSLPAPMISCNLRSMLNYADVNCGGGTVHAIKTSGDRS